MCADVIGEFSRRPTLRPPMPRPPSLADKSAILIVGVALRSLGHFRGFAWYTEQGAGGQVARLTGTDGAGTGRLSSGSRPKALKRGAFAERFCNRERLDG